MLRRFLAKFQNFLEHLVDIVRLRLIGPNLLEDIPQIPLRSELQAALDAYGVPYEQVAADDLPETQVVSFEVHNLHHVQVWVWKSAVHQILFTSPRGDADMDLQTVFSAYGGGKKWRTWTEGYLYGTEDGSIRLWCSAMPTIGVGTTEFIQFRDSHRSSGKSES